MVEFHKQNKIMKKNINNLSKFMFLHWTVFVAILDARSQ